MKKKEKLKTFSGLELGSIQGNHEFPGAEKVIQNVSARSAEIIGGYTGANDVGISFYYYSREGLRTKANMGQLAGVKK